MIQEALVKQKDAFAARPRMRLGFTKKEEMEIGLARANGEVWKIHRRFALSTLRDFGYGRPILEPRIRDEAEYLIEAFEKFGGAPFDPTASLQWATCNILLSMVFGRRYQSDDKNLKQLMDSEQLRRKIGTSFLTAYVLSKRAAFFAKVLPQARLFYDSHDNLKNLAVREIGEIKRNFSQSEEATNYVEAFCKARAESKDASTFTDVQLMTSATNLIGGGLNGIAGTLRWAIMYMSHYPEWQERVYDEIRNATGKQSLSYADRLKLPITEAVIMETQRCANVGPFSSLRQTTVDCKLCGYDIPAGTAIVPFLTSVLYDPEVYPNPEKFDPTRFMNGNKNEDKFTHLIPFSVGKRVCLGEPLARMEIFLLLTTLFSKFQFSFPPDEPKPPCNVVHLSFMREPVPYKICAKLRQE